MVHFRQHSSSVSCIPHVVSVMQQSTGLYCDWIGSNSPEHDQSIPNNFVLVPCTYTVFGQAQSVVRRVCRLDTRVA